MTVAWSRFDAEVQQLKRLSAQISCRDLPPVQATLWSQSRRQSAASRRAIAGRRTNGPPRSALNVSTYGTDVLTSQLMDTAMPSPSLPQCMPAVVEMPQPCTISTTYSTSVIQRTVVAGSHVCPPSVCTTLTAAARDTPQPTAAVSGMDSELETDLVMCAWAQSDRPDESVHLVVSNGDVSSVSAVASDAVTDVAAIQQTSHSVDESSPYVCQLSTLNCRDIESCKNSFC